MAQSQPASRETKTTKDAKMGTGVGQGLHNWALVGQEELAFQALLSHDAQSTGGILH